jgi:thioredoxin 1
MGRRYLWRRRSCVSAVFHSLVSEPLIHMSEKIANLTTESFKSAINTATTPVLVDFWAPWCGPCKAIAPTLEELATELDGKLQIAKVNIDDHDSIAAEYGVRAIPTMILFKAGQVAETLVGMMPKAALKAKLASHVA